MDLSHAGLYEDMLGRICYISLKAPMSIVYRAHLRPQPPTTENQVMHRVRAEHTAMKFLPFPGLRLTDHRKQGHGYPH